MAVFPIASSLPVLLSFIILCIFHVLPTGGSTALSFSVKLIHRDNPESPVYDPTSTPLSRMRAVVQRSVALANYFHNTSASANSRRHTTIDDESFFLDGMGYHGTYLIELGMGEPPQHAHFGISTSDDMSFVMCNPCKNCGIKDAAFFDPKNSTTYNTVLCKSHWCKSIHSGPCGSAKNRVCKYEERPYGRHLIISGILSNETIHLQNMAGGVSVHGFLFGCTNKIMRRPDNGKLARNRIGIGMMGLNNHTLSFLSQLRTATYGKLSLKFSYCLSLKINEVSQLYFGYTPPFDKGSQTTPLFVSPFNHRYFLQLENIAVFFDGKTPLNISVDQGNHRGNMLIESSSPITYISREEMMTVKIYILNRMRLQRVQVPEGLAKAIELCYNWQPRDERELPIIDLIFKNGAIMSSMNLFSEVVKNVICLLLAPADRFTLGVRVLGTGPQLTHRIAIDLEKKAVEFKRGFCDNR